MPNSILCGISNQILLEPISGIDARAILIGMVGLDFGSPSCLKRAAEVIERFRRRRLGTLY
jgi:hypothetical protein